MKKMKFILLALVAMLPFLQSCNSDVDQASTGNIVTVKANFGSGFYFELDNKQKLYPSDMSRVSGYSIIDSEGNSKNNTRAFIFYNTLSSKTDGYDQDIAIYAITEIKTDNVSTILSEDQANLLGKLPAEIEDNTERYPSIFGDFLHFAYWIKVEDPSNTTITLIENPFATPPAECTDEYTYLELYHSNTDDDGEEEDEEDKHFYGYAIAYNLKHLSPAITGKGLCIRYINFEDEVAYTYVDYTAIEE